jgi:hypothetical protein
VLKPQEDKLMLEHGVSFRPPRNIRDGRFLYRLTRLSQDPPPKILVGHGSKLDFVPALVGRDLMKVEVHSGAFQVRRN